jgi:formylglycine-generating enzyme required for sulfatase activity
VLVGEATLSIGPSDWEAERVVAPHTIHVEAFQLDAFEVTSSAYRGDTGAEGLRAASGMTRAAAAEFCRVKGGRLPTEDEWIAAAASASNPPPRYPWGDTGAVCRRAAWGLLGGPCATGADGPDTVGSHPDGDSPLGLHDLAGNVAEWVAPSSPSSAPAAPAVAKGGSWQSDLASDLRIWARLELPPVAGDARVGFRCAYYVDR